MRETTYPPSHGDLVQKSLDYLRNNHPNAWRLMTDRTNGGSERGRRQM